MIISLCQQNVKYDDGYDDDDANTHFMAYSLTAIILILATYIMVSQQTKGRWTKLGHVSWNIYRPDNSLI